MPVERVRMLLDVWRDPASLDAPLPDGVTPLGELIVDVANSSPEEHVLRTQLAREVAHAMRSLNDREREVVRLRHGVGVDQPMTLDAIGRQLGVTRERIRQIEKRALAKMHAASSAA
jgi:RNA polymerase primary sigma factor